MWDLQRLVYAVEVGGIRKFLFGGAVFAAMLALAAYYGVSQFNGLASAEAMDQAQLGRNLAEGRGFTTWFIRPLAIGQFREMGVPDRQISLTSFPDTINPPAYPMLLGLVFKVFNPVFVVSPEAMKTFQTFDPERLVILTGIACTLAAGVVLFFWVLRTFDLVAAIAAIILFMLTDLIWQFSISGLSVSWTMLLVSLVGWSVNESLLAEEGDKKWMTVVWLGIAGVFTSLLILTRYSYLWTLIPFSVFIFFCFSKRWIILPVFFGVVLLLTGWWWLRNITVSGNPLGLTWISVYLNSGRFPGGTLWRTLGIEPGILGLRPFMRSLIYGVTTQMTTLSNLAGGFLIVTLGVGSVLHSFRSFAASRGRWFWLGMTVVIFLASGPSFVGEDPDKWNETNQIAPLIPVFLCFGSAFLLVLLDRIYFPVRLLKYLLLAGICLIQGIPIGLRMAGTTPKFPYPPYFPPVLIVTANYVKEDEVQMSDIPWASAWYQGRNTLWLPMKRDEFYSIHDMIHPISLLLLTPYSYNARLYSDIRSGEYEDWAGLVSRTDLSKSPFPAPMPLWPKDKWDYFMFADHIRSGL